MKRMGFLTVVCAAALTIGCGNNARTDNDVSETAVVGTAGEAERTAVNDSEKDFVNRQLANGTAEVELGKLASERASNPDVKRFGQMMVQDHTKAGTELKELAAKHGIQAAPEVDEKHHDLMDRLSKLRGMEFDREYIGAMVDDHQNAVDALQERVENTAGLKERTTNPESANAQGVVPAETDNIPAAAINAWAAKTLPTIRQHLDQARMLDDQLDRRDDNTTRNRNNGNAPTNR